MVRRARNQRLREKMQADVKHSKQTTLGNIKETHEDQPKPKPENRKQIVISEIATLTREDELTVKVSFRLFPSPASFSTVYADLFFDEEKVEILRLRVLQGALASDCLEFSSVLDMTGISQGIYFVRAELYELWDFGERLNSTSKEVEVDFVPVKREDRLVRVPLVKSVAGASLTVVSESEKNLLRELKEEMKQEERGRRDRW